MHGGGTYGISIESLTPEGRRVLLTTNGQAPVLKNAPWDVFLLSRYP